MSAICVNISEWTSVDADDKDDVYLCAVRHIAQDLVQKITEQALVRLEHEIPVPDCSSDHDSASTRSSQCEQPVSSHATARRPPERFHLADTFLHSLFQHTESTSAATVRKQAPPRSAPAKKGNSFKKRMLAKKRRKELASYPQQVLCQATIVAS